MTLRGACTGLCTVVALTAAPVSAATPLVQESPTSGTPHVIDRTVRAVATIGDHIVLGGDFTRAQDDGAPSSVSRHGLLSFDRTTLKLTSLSLPITGIVYALAPAGGDRIFVGGDFSVKQGGVRRSNLALVDLGTRSVVKSFDAGPIKGPVKDLELAAGQLWVAGGFSRIRTTSIRGLATLSPRSGKVTPYTRLRFAGQHRGGDTKVQKIAVTPDRKRLFAIGNFVTVEGQRREQFAAIGLGRRSASLLRYRTRFFQPRCPVRNNETYLTDIDISPDGRFLVVVTTGGLGDDKSGCDGAFRFETRLNGSDVRPTWLAHTGGDTVTSVEITDSVVYVGGHFRYFNNPYPDGSSIDAQPGPGATARPGIAALDKLNGMPLPWNPTRDRGKAAYDLMATSQGLWVASDTETIGPGDPAPVRKRIALLPAGGLPVTVPSTASLPGHVYVTGAYGAVQTPGIRYRINAGGPALAASNALGWAADRRAAPSMHHRSGPQQVSRKGVTRRAADVPATTPQALFADSLVGTDKRPNQSWRMKATPGEPLYVRLYFARPCDCKGVGTWSQSIRIDGKRRLKSINVAKVAGRRSGIVRSFAITPSDGVLDIDLLARRGRTTLAGLEVLTQVSQPAITGSLLRRPATTKTFGALTANPVAGPNWADLRGAFMLGGELYTAWTGGSFTKQTFDGSSVGTSTPVIGSDELVPLTAWKNDAAAATSMFYDSGRIYFTRVSSPHLYYRYFNPSTGMVGATRHIAASDSAVVSYTGMRGAFVAGSGFYWATNDGALRRATWERVGTKGFPLSSTAKVVSGVGVDSHYWLERSIFLGP